MTALRLASFIALTGCIDSVGFPAAEDTGGGLDPCTVHAREPNDGDGNYTHLGLIHPDRTVVWCGTVSGNAGGEYGNDYEVGLLRLRETQQLSFELDWDGRADLQMYLNYGDTNGMESDQNGSPPGYMSALVGAGYLPVTVVGSSSGSAKYSMVITAD